jgi:hypothetical protein
VTIYRWLFRCKTTGLTWKNVSFSKPVSRERAWEKFVTLNVPKPCPTMPFRADPDDFDWWEVPHDRV